MGGSGGLFVFDGLQFGGIVIVGCCDCGWRWLWLWLWMLRGFHGCGSGCYEWLWLWKWWVIVAVIYCIILLFCLYYFNILMVKMKSKVFCKMSFELAQNFNSFDVNALMCKIIFILVLDVLEVSFWRLKVWFRFQNGPSLLLVSPLRTK